MNTTADKKKVPFTTEKSKKSKGLIITYVIIILAITTTILYLFFGNQNRISFTVESTNDLIKKQRVLLQDLERGRVAQVDSFLSIQKQHLVAIDKKDSIIKKEKQIFKIKEKKYNEKIDSLVTLINGFQRSDLEPVRRKKE